jgi:hypothetical protein
MYTFGASGFPARERVHSSVVYTRLRQGEMAVGEALLAARLSKPAAEKRDAGPTLGPSLGLPSAHDGPKVGPPMGP